MPATPAAQHAGHVVRPSRQLHPASLQVKLTLMLAAVAVPINTMFGITAAVILARNEFPGKTWVMTILDLPFSISPVITGERIGCTLAATSINLQPPVLTSCE